VLDLRRLAWGICLLTLAVVASAIVLVVINRESIHGLDDASQIEIVLPIGCAILGGLVASRQPRNALGWIFLAISFANGLPGLSDQYTRFAQITDPGAPFSPWIPWAGQLTDSLVNPAGLAVIAMLLIPNGRLLSPAWRWVAWIGAALTAGLVIFSRGWADLKRPRDWACHSNGAMTAEGAHIGRPASTCSHTTPERPLDGRMAIIAGAGAVGRRGAGGARRGT
jgi:hypothetical protein